MKVPWKTIPEASAFQPQYLVSDMQIEPHCALQSSPSASEILMSDLYELIACGIKKS
jgi:hypothetical protein